MRKCKQNQCGFLQAKQGCRKCDDCGVDSFILSEDCIRCENCESIPNNLRWDDNKPDIEEKQLLVASKIS